MGISLFFCPIWKGYQRFFVSLCPEMCNICLHKTNEHKYQSMESHFDIFISYRRHGGSERAELMKAILEKHGYDSQRIFMDTHALRGGDFRMKLAEAVAEAEDFVLLITKGCFNNIKVEDYWIFEIKEALRLKKNLIPVFFDGITSLEGSQVPPIISNLSTQNAVSYNHEYADAFYAKLCSFLTTQPSTRKSGFVKIINKGKNMLGCTISLSIVLLLALFFVPLRQYWTSDEAPAQDASVSDIPDNQEVQESALQQPLQAQAHILASTFMMEYDESYPYATGFFISSDGLALTASHYILEDDINHLSTIVTSEHVRMPIQRILLINRELDCVLFKVDTQGCMMDFLSINDKPIVGSNVLISSYNFSADCTPVLVPGIVASASTGNTFLINHADIHEGFSGAPVCNSEGEVIGFIQGKKTDSKDQSVYVANLQKVKEIINQYR